MTDSRTPLEPQDDLIDVRQPGRARTVYTVVAVLVVISLIIGMAGFAVWDRLF